MKKRFKSESMHEGYKLICDSNNSGLKYIEMGWLFLQQSGAVYKGKSGDNEIGLNLMSGVIRLKVLSQEKKAYDYPEVGQRMNLFSGNPAMVYLPTHCEYTIEVLKGPFQAAVYSAPSDLSFEPCVVRPQDIITFRTGESNWTRFVRQGIAGNVQAHRLILGETLTPSGNWTSYPPHKHDENRPPFEKPSEEVYSFHYDNPLGYALIRLYTPKEAQNPFDEAYVVGDGDIITIERGYHPIAVAPGYKCCYLFCLAGEERNYGAWSDDPDHSWIRGAESVLRGNELK